MRDVERMAQGTEEPEAPTSSAKKPKLEKKSAPKDADTRALEKTLSDALGLVVEIDHQGGESGELRIHYKTLDQLDAVCHRLNR